MIPIKGLLTFPVSESVVTGSDNRQASLGRHKYSLLSNLIQYKPLRKRIIEVYVLSVIMKKQLCHQEKKPYE